ncbi:MAG: Crp/Fnr family transcriptional regulator [Bacteroidota bacterium]
MKLQSIPVKVFATHSELIQVPANSYLLREGQLPNYLYYIHQGALMLLEDGPGNQHCQSFQLEGAFYGSYTALLGRMPSAYNLLALEDCLLERIPYQHLPKAFATRQGSIQSAQQITEELLRREAQRLYNQLNQRAEQRYLDLLEEQPLAVYRVPLKHIASYLGITPVTLSRLRKRISEREMS